jgi:hypothetical protein
MIDRLLPQHLIVRVLGVVLLCSGVYLAVRGRWGYFGSITVALGAPAGLGLLLYRRWGRVLGLLYFGALGALAAVLILMGSGPTRNNLSLLLEAVGGGWAVYKWSD